MLHSDDREVEPDQLPDLARPGAGGVHDHLGEDLPLVGRDPPLAAPGPREPRHPRARADAGPRSRAPLTKACVTLVGST